MRKILLAMGMVLVFTLSACTTNYEYADFGSREVTSFLQGETKNEETYFLYYYKNDCAECDDIKQDILTFFDEIDGTSFYLLNVDEASDETTLNFSDNTPSLFVISNGVVTARYESKDGIEEFLEEFEELKEDDLDDIAHYDMFDHIYSFEDALTQEEGTYYVYFYSPTCGYCNLIKEQMIDYTLTAPDGIKMYLLNAQDMSSFTNDFDITGTPSVIVVENNEYVESVKGYTNVLSYLNLAANAEYSEFDHIDTFDDVETQPEGTYYVYFYSPFCGYCNQIKEDMLEYIENEPEGIKMYLLDGSQLPDYSNDYGVTGTPAVLHVVDNEFVEKVSGSISVLEFLNIVSDRLDYGSFEHLESYDDVENQEEGTYLVYYYSTTCGFCNQIKEEVLAFADENDKNLKVYMLNAKEVPTDDPYDITGTPTMLYIVDNEFEEKIVGAVDVPAFLESVKPYGEESTHVGLYIGIAAGVTVAGIGTMIFLKRSS